MQDHERHGTETLAGRLPIAGEQIPSVLVLAVEPPCPAPARPIRLSLPRRRKQIGKLIKRLEKPD